MSFGSAQRQKRTFHDGGKRRSMRSNYRRYLTAGMFVAAYVTVSFFVLAEREEPGSDANILIFLFGAAIAGGLGAILAPVLPVLLGFAPRRRQ